MSANRKHRRIMLGIFKEMRVSVLVVGDSRRVQKIAREIARTWTLGGDSESYHRGSLWDSFTRLVEQGQEVNTGVGGYGRQVGKVVRQS